MLSLRVDLVLCGVLMVGACQADAEPPMWASAECAVSRCMVPIRTQGPPAPREICAAAAIGGQVARDAEWGLGLQGQDGSVVGVVWPHGYSARNTPDGIELLEPPGVVVAIEGDHVAMGGAMGEDLVAWPCNGLGLVQRRP